MCFTSLAHRQPEQRLPIQKRYLRFPAVSVGGHEERSALQRGGSCPGHTHPVWVLQVSCPPALLHTLPGATRNTNEHLHLGCLNLKNVTLIQMPLSCPGPAPWLWSWGHPRSVLSVASQGQMEKLCVHVAVPKQELIPAHLKWEKLKRARCQRHFSNFLESTGLLESSNCSYQKNIK